MVDILFIFSIGANRVGWVENVFCIQMMLKKQKSMCGWALIDVCYFPSFFLWISDTNKYF